MSLSHGCPKGTTLRRSYTRIFRNNTVKQGYTVRRKGTLFVVHPRTQPVRVPAHCVRSRKAPSSRNGSLRKGDLLQFGYQYRLSDAKRHKALKRAVQRHGAKPVYRRLHEVAEQSVTAAPDASVIFSRDRNWVRGQFPL